MKAIKLAVLELCRFRGRIRLLLPAMLLCVPLLYGALYLWANWNPQGQLSKVPVAVINDDRPVDRAGQHIDAGARFVEQVRATERFDWHVVDEAEAQQGLQRGKYYFTVTVPRDFSARLATASNTVPKRAALEITKNDANGYLAGLVADSARADLQNQVNAAAHAAYTRALYGKLDTVRDKLQIASETSGELVKGSDLSKQSTATLTSGLGGARGGAGEVASSAREVSSAGDQLAGDLAALRGFTEDGLPKAADDLVGAGESAVAGLRSAADAPARSTSSALEELRARHPDIAADPAYQRAAHSSRETPELRQALARAEGALARARAVRDDLGPLRERVLGMTGSVEAVKTGAARVSDGAEGVNRDLHGMVASSRVLQTGVGQLNDDAKRLTSTVKESLGRIPPTTPAQVTKAADVLGKPAEITTTTLNAAEVHGRGVAPLFFGLALWVCGLLAYALFAPVNMRALASRLNPWTIAVAGWLPAAFLAAVGGLVLFGVADLALGLAPVHLGATVGVVALGAAAFVAIDHFLRTALGRTGAVVSLVLLMVQLVVCGGFHPLETTPMPIQQLHPFLPMTYLVEGLRISITGGMPEFLWHDVAVLAAAGVFALVLTTVVVHRQRSWTPQRLHPRLAL